MNHREHIFVRIAPVYYGRWTVQARTSDTRWQPDVAQLNALIIKERPRFKAVTHGEFLDSCHILSKEKAA